jgi:hypothetical protein
MAVGLREGCELTSQRPMLVGCTRIIGQLHNSKKEFRAAFENSSSSILSGRCIGQIFEHEQTNEL